MIILTGGAGFIGSNILERLNQDGEEDILVVDNLTSSEKYRNLVGKKFRDFVSKNDFLAMLEAGKFKGIQAILHQGACTDTLEYNGDYMMRNNFEYSKSLLHYALVKKIPMVYASSAAVYGHSEVAVEDAGDEAPLNIYGYSKHLFDQYAKRFFNESESTIVGLRYFNVYGYGEAHKGKMSSMVFQLANQVRETGVARLFGGIGKYGPGEQTRDFVFVDDLVDMNLHFLRGPVLRTVVNAGTGVSSSWNDLANAVINHLGKGKIEYFDFPESLKDKYQFNTRASGEKLRKLGYEKRFATLSEGVGTYLEKIRVADSKYSANAKV
jgi:ADP-L-glycero-D-manno-heptose 6-epimerase